MNRSAIAAKVAARKEKHPELYCRAPLCLWRTDREYCPRHTVRYNEGAAQDWEREIYRREDGERKSNDA